MTNQEIFDTVKAHLLKQNARATSRPTDTSATLCRYRLGALKCAAGCLIKDEFYSPDLEGSSVAYGFGNTDSANRIRAAIQKSIGDFDVDLVSILQKVHDCYSPAQWPEQLAWVAKVWSLNG